MTLRRSRVLIAMGAPLGLALLLFIGCGGEDADAGGGRPGGGRPSGGQGGPGGFGGPPSQDAAVPVEVTPVLRQEIASYIQTNGTLEAENEVDILARVTAPIVALNAEEGMAVRRGQVLARLEEDELRARLDVSRVARDEAQLSYDRAQQLRDQQLISTEAFEQARNRLETAKAQLDGDEIQMSYTTIHAPFDGLIVTRYVDFAQQVSANTPLFRISDFDPLLCPIQVPERELSLLKLGQEAYVEVEAWSGERFSAKVLRISPVVDAATGTIKVTLEVRSKGKLRPGMFARAFLKTASKSEALVIPKAALSLESIGDTVYVAANNLAQRREVTLGFQEGDLVEIVEGLAEGEPVVTVGQDGLSDGTPIQVLDPVGSTAARTPATPDASAAQGAPSDPSAPSQTPATGEASSRSWGGGEGMANFDLSKATPEQLERIKAMMKARGLTDAEIEERLKKIKD